MADDRMLAAFRTFDAPLDPDPAFADRLFEDLAVDLGYRPERGLAGLRRRARRALGLERPPVGSQALRLAYLAAFLGLLLALAFGAARPPPLPPRPRLRHPRLRPRSCEPTISR